VATWSIQYCIRPDLRYNPVFLTIKDVDVPAFIVALKENRDKYCELKKASPIYGETVRRGKLGMEIRIGGHREGVYSPKIMQLFKSAKDINIAVKRYKYAIKKAAEIQKDFLAP